MATKKINFSVIAQTALHQAIPLLMNWLPNGRLIGSEYVSKNPLRDDRHGGSFKISVRTGRWADFAVGVAGGDLISLYAYLFSCTQSMAARELASTLGVSHE